MAMNKLKQFRKVVGLGFLLLALVALLIPTVAGAATTAVGTVTGFSSYISVSLNVTQWNMGVIEAGVDKTTGARYFGITNGSSIPTTNTIQMTTPWHSLVGGGNWTYGAPGQDTCQLKASDGDQAFDVTVLTGSGTVLHTAGALENWAFELQFDAPSSVTFDGMQSGSFTIAAVAS